MCFRYSFWYLRLTQSWSGIIHLADRVKIGFQLRLRAGFCMSLWALLFVTGCGGGGGGISTNYPQQPSTIPFLSVARIGDDEIGNQNGVAQVQADYAIENGFQGQNVTIGILDKGIDSTHSELQGKVTDGGDWAYGGSGLIDHNGHGTHIAGIIAAKQDGSGIVGVAPKASLKSYKLFNADGRASQYGFHHALQQVLNDAQKSNVSVLNNSWSNSDSMEQIFNKGVSASVRNELPAWKQAVKNGKVIVFAAGNNVRNQPSIHSGLPAHDPNLTKGWLAVVAVDSNQQETIYSNRCGLAADWCLAAPGGGDYPAANGIISTRVGGHFTRMSGTSMAAPHVSGGIATVMSAFPTLSAQTAAARLLGSASYDGLRTLSGCTLERCGLDKMRDIFGRGKMDLKAALSPLGQLRLSGSGLTAASSSLSLSPTLHNSLTSLFHKVDLQAVDSFDKAVFNLNAANLIKSPEIAPPLTLRDDALQLLNPLRQKPFSFQHSDMEKTDNAHAKSKLTDLSTSKRMFAIDHIYFTNRNMPIISRLQFQPDRTSVSAQFEQNTRFEKNNSEISWWIGNGVAVGNNNWLGSTGKNALELGRSSDVWMFSGARWGRNRNILQAEAIYGHSFLQGGNNQMIRAANVRLFGWAITNRLQVTSNSHFSIGLSNPVQPIAGHVKFTGVTSAASELTTFKIGSHGARAVQEIGFRSQLSNSSLFWIGHKISANSISGEQKLTEVGLQINL